MARSTYAPGAYFRLVNRATGYDFVALDRPELRGSWVLPLQTLPCAQRSMDRLPIDSLSHLSSKVLRHANTASCGPSIMGADPTLDQPLEPRQRRVWEFVSRFPRRSLWNLQGIPLRLVANRTWKALFADNIFGITLVQISSAVLRGAWKKEAESLIS
jgi:hypothetical protein